MIKNNDYTIVCKCIYIKDIEESPLEKHIKRIKRIDEILISAVREALKKDIALGMLHMSFTAMCAGYQRCVMCPLDNHCGIEFSVGPLIELLESENFDLDEFIFELNKYIIAISKYL